jgi:succinate dehydrogenase/fumarate reductase cytochrome b subunit
MREEAGTLNTESGVRSQAIHTMIATRPQHAGLSRTRMASKLLDAIVPGFGAVGYCMCWGAFAHVFGCIRSFVIRWGCIRPCVVVVAGWVGELAIMLATVCVLLVSIVSACSSRY